jgi:hypothetical protein
MRIRSRPKARSTATTRILYEYEDHCPDRRWSAAGDGGGGAGGDEDQLVHRIGNRRVKNCIISAANLDLGTFDGTNDLDTATSNITFAARTALPYSVGLSRVVTALCQPQAQDRWHGP